MFLDRRKDTIPGYLKVADYLLSDVGMNMMRELEEHLNKATIVSIYHY